MRGNQNEKFIPVDAQSNVSAAQQNLSYKSNQSGVNQLTPRKSGTQTRNLLDPAQFRVPDTQQKNTQPDDEEERKDGQTTNQKGVTTITTGNTTHITSVVEPPDRKKKNIVVNTIHCRNEVDTVQYVVSKFGYKETRVAADGNIFWYGLALRDNDVELIKMKKAMINRYPLMDVSNLLYYSNLHSKGSKS